MKGEESVQLQSIEKRVSSGHSPSCAEILLTTIQEMNREENLLKALNLFTQRSLVLFDCDVAAIYLFEQGKYKPFSVSFRDDKDRETLMLREFPQDFREICTEVVETDEEWVLALSHFNKTLGAYVLKGKRSHARDEGLAVFVKQVISIISSFIFERILKIDSLGREQALTLLLRGTEILVRADSEEQLLSEAGEMAMEILFLPGGFFLLEGAGGTWEIRSPFGRLKQEMEWDWRTWVRQYISKEECCLRSAKVHFFDIENNPFKWERVWIHPLQTHSGVVGELWLMNAGKYLNDQEQEILTAFIRVVGVALETIRQREELARLANTDRLTGILNRQGFEQRVREEIASTLRRDSRFLFLVLDLDRFKQLNDTLGHPMGDRALKEIAQNLRCAVREQDIVARTGGDEFTVVLTDIALNEESLTVIERMRKSMHLEVYNLGVSIGVAEFPTEGRTYDELYRLADQRLYRGKNSGKGNIIAD
ncbi:diguanylate cyclase [Desulfitobacterium chlororespirans]|uniref:diguanylate cyclase n=1 Tax=Desulfitobacterium chlororespirans TaxID=51616 RepID=UPI00093214C4